MNKHTRHKDEKYIVFFEGFTISVRRVSLKMRNNALIQRAQISKLVSVHAPLSRRACRRNTMVNEVADERPRAERT